MRRFTVSAVCFLGLWLLPVCAAQAGYLIAWGERWNGECDVPPGDDYVAVAAGGSHGLALRADGSLAGWGLNGYGQTDVPAGNDFVAISAGAYHSLALRRDGSLAIWGMGADVKGVPAGNDYIAVAAGKNRAKTGVRQKQQKQGSELFSVRK